MVITLDHINKLKDNLYQKHPDLDQVKIKKLSETNLSYKEISDFIEDCWTHDYGNEARIKFSPDFLKTNIGQLDSNEASLVATLNDKICGIALGFEQTFSNGKTSYNTILNTGLSVHPDYRKKGEKKLSGGIGQLIWISQTKQQIDAKNQFSQFWFDSRHSWPGSSFKIFGEDKNKMEKIIDVAIYGKALDLKKSAEIGNISSIEKIGAGILKKIFPAKKLNYNKLELHESNTQDLNPILNFYKSQINSEEFQRVYSKNELECRLTSNNYHIFNLIEKGEIKGIIMGFNNESTNGEKYFQIDNITFSEELEGKAKRKFISAVEENLLNSKGYFSVVIPETGTKENMLKHGYIQIEKQNIAVNLYQENLNHKELTNMSYELR